MNPKMHLKKRVIEVKAAMGSPLRTYAQIAAELHVSPERVRQIEDEAIMKLIVRMADPTFTRRVAA